MAKFYGIIGYTETVETKPGVWKPNETRREYFGDLIRNTSGYESAGQVNDNLKIANEISIVADPYARQNFYSMRYVEFMEFPGAKWKITSVEVQYPRLILTIGGMYNDGETKGNTANPA